MGQVLDFDAVVVETTEIKKTINGKQCEWALRDDIPPEVMLAMFGLQAHAQVQAEIVAEMKTSVDGTDAAAVEAAIDEMGKRLLTLKERQTATVTHVCGDIFRHSYPETTDDDIIAWFTPRERGDIAQLFFTRQLQASSQLSNATTPTPTPNRATRRASSKRSSGAIPSQKRLSRSLNAL